MRTLESFLEVVAETHEVWLLEAMTGMFAMLEDADGHSYIPLWATESEARQAAVEDWEDYKVTEMGFSELAQWLKELSRDEIDIAVSPERDGEIMAIASHNFRKWVTPLADDSYHEEPDDDEDETFDYGDGWEEKW
ncbi:MAG: DUF2750 domain-containing protein [Bacteroidales bacterium]|nr:DUF2750 domain-containing protein [Bacteroidales bacterium]